MDTPLAAAIHKENVHIGGEKATVTMKPDKLKTAGKKRKSSADLELVAGASKDVDLKQNSAMKDNEIKKNQMTRGKQHVAAAYRTTKKPNHILTDEEIKQGHKLDEYERYEVGDVDDWSEIFKLKTLPEMMYAMHGAPISKLEQPFLRYEEGYKTDGPDFKRSKLVPGPYSFVYTPEELDDALDKARMVLKKYPFPELKSYDD